METEGPVRFRPSSSQCRAPRHPDGLCPFPGKPPLLPSSRAAAGNLCDSSIAVDAATSWSDPAFAAPSGASSPMFRASRCGPLVPSRSIVSRMSGIPRRTRLSAEGDCGGGCFIAYRHLRRSFEGRISRARQKNYRSCSCAACEPSRLRSCQFSRHSAGERSLRRLSDGRHHRIQRRPGGRCRTRSP
jgi:hypothetical protein